MATTTTVGEIRKMGVGVVFQGSDNLVYILVLNPVGDRASMIKVNDVYLKRNQPSNQKFACNKWEDGIPVYPVT